MKPKNNSPEFEVTIEGWAKNGCGTGKYHSTYDGGNYAIEAPFTAPGDKITARVMRERKNYYSCEMVKINTPSQERITAKCKHFASCGGCQLQHISGEQALAYKESNVSTSFASLITDSVTVYPITPAASPWGYRNRMDYTFTENERKDKFLGLLMHFGKCQVLNITECPIGSDWFIEAIKVVRHWWQNAPLEAYHQFKNTGTLCNFSVHEGLRSGDRLAILTVRGLGREPIKKGLLNTLVEALKKKISPPTGSSLRIILRVENGLKSGTNYSDNILYGTRPIHDIMHIQSDASMPEKKISFHINPSISLQPNSREAEKFHSRIVEIADITPEAIVYDLYCGSGILSICLASYAKHVYSVDRSRAATADACANMTLNDITNMTVITSLVCQLLKPSQKEYPLAQDPDVLVISSPREGPDAEALQIIIKLRPKKIVYTASNLDIQAKNIASLIEAGYRLESLQPMDLFPQIVRVENIALLIRV